MPSKYFPLYDPGLDHDACGLGFVARVDGRRTHEIVEQGLNVLHNLTHRGAAGADPDTGDGAGILLQLPDAFLRAECKRLGICLPLPGGYGAGMIFFSHDDELRRRCEAELEGIVAEEGLSVLGWRDVPFEACPIGEGARRTMPRIRQVFIERRCHARLDAEAFERALYVIRRRLHRVVLEQYGGASTCYVVSLSSRTMVYKGLLHGTQLPLFYPDLRNPQVASAIALVHSRFGTNTLGTWQLAHPFRYMAHNGEINTLRGNINWMRAREAKLESALFGTNMEKLRPVFEPSVSDSASFDNALELLVMAGRSLPHAVMTMMPEAWENDEGMDPDRRAFYQYHGSLMEPWDGPAAIAFSDGKLVGAALDRNGLRPARYSMTADGLVVLASEEGVLPIPEEDVVHRWRLQPGKMLLVDTVRHQILRDHEVKNVLARRRPYRRWVEEGTVTLEGLPPAPAELHANSASLPALQRAFGYTMEDLRILLPPMAMQGKEADGSMGTDTPLAVLSERPQLLFAYFKQLFAQVTNPPIDPLREELVMSLAMSLGPEINLLGEGPDHCRRIRLEHPILDADELERLRSVSMPALRAVTLSLLFPAENGPAALGPAVERLCSAAEAAVRNGATILILSDRGVNEQCAAIPALLATAAVHHHLVREGIRTQTGLVVETGEAREVQHIALLIGYGAAAVHPYLALQTVRDLAARGSLGDICPEKAAANYRKAVGKGLLKIMSKMGISTLFSYCGAQIFEAIGLDRALVQKHFSGTPSRLGGIDLIGVARETLERHAVAFTARADEELFVGGEYQQRVQGEYHQWNPHSIANLQRAVQTGRFETFQQYTAHFDSASQLATLRGLLDFRPGNSVLLEEVEPASEIVKRFSTGAMSFGSLSREAHETLAIALNRIGGRSNTGEGGEEPERWQPDPNGDSRRSAIKQVASARFGVTTAYLVNADSLQIKMAQGAKPGEGGQLPGHKVADDIARVRHSTPGVTLISPPPHHDIYSIEDLAQLIHDLKNVNPQAEISVKLVSEVGVGTIAAGVAKAKADHITIAGHDGGTGASPLSSIKHTGLPWELGLAETQQVLVANGLRGRVRLQTDGQLKTGRDVAVAALLGAEEFSFSTAPLVATGCIMMRACHLNTCPVGIATQDPELRRRFAGKPEHVINFFFFIAEELRRIMAALGFRRLEDMVGRADLLAVRGAPHWKAAALDLSPLLAPPQPGAILHHCEAQDHGLGGTLDHTLMDLVMPDVGGSSVSRKGVGGSSVSRPSPVLDHTLIHLASSALQDRQHVTIGTPEAPLPIHNTNRTVGAMLSGEIARRFGPDGLPDGTIDVYLRGTAGQSFGAWATSGLTLALEGAANDYPGKGLSGGRLVVRPPDNAGYDAESSVVAGNVALYGATGGQAFFRGIAGERFAVRNSGAEAVVEGVGDHGCEYMTGGVVLVLGPSGRNFAAGMSGGMAIVLDLWNRFESMCNHEMVGLEPLAAHEDMVLVRRLLHQHLEWTGSTVAARILDHWAEYQSRFVKVMPHDLRRVMQQNTDLLAEKAV